MYKKLLAPLDGSGFSECSLAHVKAIASGCNVPEVILLTVVEPLPQAPEASEEWREEAKKNILEGAKDYIAGIEKNLRGDGLAAKSVVTRGKPDEEILDYAKDNEVDLIIMSTHGRSGASRWLFGSVADRVMRHSPVPVLLLPLPTG